MDNPWIFGICGVWTASIAFVSRFTQFGTGVKTITIFGLIGYVLYCKFAATTGLNVMLVLSGTAVGAVFEGMLSEYVIQVYRWPCFTRSQSTQSLEE